jgi:hypothetical protein
LKLFVLVQVQVPPPSFTEGYVTGDVTSVLKAERAERPGVRFRHPSAIYIRCIIVIKITKEEMKKAIETSSSMRSACVKLGLHFNTFSRYAKIFGLYRPNQGNKGISKPKIEGNGKYKLDDILEGKHPEYQSRKLKLRLFQAGIKNNKCEECGIDSWNKKGIVCELDHIDGNSNNHKLENLRILCPNCHSQTSTFRYKKRIKAVVME